MAEKTVKTEVKTTPAAKKAAAKPGVNKADSGKKLKITLIKSTIGCLDKQKKTVEALGLKKIRQSAIHNDDASTRGMIFVVKHLVKVEEVV